ncbi:hypothetical protein [Iamia sp.]|uniref:dihydrofolate reductase family protein n=1 Tax=Iamia sp. TaxID=2722710 RepID=UPI002C181CDF|nr:hypothetical protein [Iamia sp.]HXH57947.1 hypothetical protein [Iamia sp.]
MRSTFLHINVSLDGLIEDANHDIDWHFIDDEFEEYINEILRSVDGMVFGGVAHQALAHYWPTAASQPDDGRHRGAAQLVNDLPKYVVSDQDYRRSGSNCSSSGASGRLCRGGVIPTRA